MADNPYHDGKTGKFTSGKSTSKSQISRRNRY